MATGVFITKESYDAATETNIDNYIFNSDYDTLKYHAKGEVTVTINYANYYDYLDSMFGRLYYHRGVVTVAHGLGYIPFFRGYVDVGSGDGTTMSISPYYIADVFYWNFKLVYADSTNLYFVVEERNMDNIGSRSYYFTYRIFRNKLSI